MPLTQKQKSQGKWQRKFDHKAVDKVPGLTLDDKKVLYAILKLRHMRHTGQCGVDCEPGWAKIPRDQLKKESGMGQDKLKETVEKLVDRGIIERKSDGEHAGRDGATRYRIILLPPYNSQKEHATEST